MHFFSKKKKSFHLQVVRISPTRGVTSGGTQVEIFGSGFGLETDNFMCLFHMPELKRRSIPALRLSSTKLSCSTPRVKEKGTAFLFVSRNGAKFVNTTIPFVFDDGVEENVDDVEESTQVEALLPSQGPSEGGTQVREFLELDDNFSITLKRVLISFIPLRIHRL